MSMTMKSKYEKIKCQPVRQMTMIMTINKRVIYQILLTLKYKKRQKP